MEAEMEKVDQGKDVQSDWPKGTVRRATRELEQKIKQEVTATALASSAPACSSRCSPINTSTRERTEETSPHIHLTPDPSTVSSHRHQPQNIVEKMEKEHSADEGSERESTGFVRSEMSLIHLRQNSSPAVFLQLDGITEQESCTDSDCPSGRCPKDMRETWESLKELGAFLWKVSGFSDKSFSPPWSRREQRKGRDLRERTKEVEARIRQAGLTRPSVMKRSASLAKLGLLELSLVDLSELDSCPAILSSSTNKPRPHLCSDDTSKKKRVVPLCTPDLPSLFTSPVSSTESHMLGHTEDCKTEEAECSDCDVMPLPLSPSSNHCCGQDNTQDAVIPLATRQQYGRTHPLRRLKKRTVNPYHTM